VQVAVRANAVPRGSDAFDSVQRETAVAYLRLNASPRFLILLAMLMLLSVWGWQEHTSREASTVPAANATSDIEPSGGFRLQKRTSVDTSITPTTL